MEERPVSHYTLEELIARWRREELTPEQMIGQLLQILRAQEQRLRDVERRVPNTPPSSGEHPKPRR
jgi:hypothetical protein